MRSHSSTSSHRPRDDAEKPFWISYADLMTALMILFLVVMITALSTITKKVEEVEIASQANEREANAKDTRAHEIQTVCEQLRIESQQTDSNIVVDCEQNRIHFGEIGRFKTGSHVLPDEGQSALLRLVPVILQAADSPLGEKWLKQIVVEGYTDTDGSYLHNLHLSLKRSEWVMCTLLRNDHPDDILLSPAQRTKLKKLFLAGGVAFNRVKNSKDESRRVELKLQFYSSVEDDNHTRPMDLKFEDDPNDRCKI